MADYYSIIKKAVEALPESSPAKRTAVYSKARAAIERQLGAINPPPGEAAIAKQMGQLEEAIQKMEVEAVALETPGADPLPGVDDVAAEMEKMMSEDPVPVPEPTPTPLPDPAAVDMPALEPVAESLSISDPTSTLEPAAPTAQALETVAPVTQATEDFASKVPSIDDFMQGGTETVSDVASTATDTAAAGVDAVDSGAAAVGASVAEIGADATDTAKAAVDVAADVIAEPQTATIPPAEQHEMLGAQIAADEPQKRGFFRRMVPYIMGLVILGAGGYGLWLNKGPLMEKFNEFTASSSAMVAPKPEMEKEVPKTEEEVEKPVVRTVKTVEIKAPKPKEEPEVEEQPVVEQPKEDVRLSKTGESIEVKPVEPIEPIVVEEAKPVIEPEPIPEETPLVVEQAKVDEPEPEPAKIEEVKEPTAEEPTVVSETTKPALGIAQKAYLYEEGGAGAGALRTNGAMIWTLDSVSPGDGLPAESVIRGKLDVPERGLLLNLTIKRNVDAGLPASHLVELNFTTSNEFEGGGIDNVARFVMKADEQARGEGLIAVPAKIDTGFFLIALNNLPQAKETNTSLLLNSSWVDVPLSYSTGRRALVTFEKGTVGDQVFKDAFADWQNR